MLGVCLSVVVCCALERESLPWGWTVASIILNKVKEQLGLDKAKVLLVGAAPIHQDVIKYFMRYGLPILELYGMSENSGPATTNTIEDWRLGSTGKPFDGSKVKIHDPDKDGEGEVSVGGEGGGALLYVLLVGIGYCDWP